MVERPTPAQPRGGPALAAAGPGRRSPRWSWSWRSCVLRRPA